ALVELLRRIDPAKLRGRLTVAFVTQQWADGRGLDRLLQQIKPDETILVGRMLPRRVSVALATGAAAGRVATLSGLPRLPQGIPGSGVSLGTADPEAALTGLALELKQLAEANKIPFATDFSAPLSRPRYGPSAPESSGMPQRFAHLGIAVRWPTTPAEFVAYGDLQNLVALLELYAQGSTRVEAASTASTQGAAGIQRTRLVSPDCLPSACGGAGGCRGGATRGGRRSRLRGGPRRSVPHGRPPSALRAGSPARTGTARLMAARRPAGR